MDNALLWIALISAVLLALWELADNVALPFAARQFPFICLLGAVVAHYIRY